jgi:predicted ester cyclase
MMADVIEELTGEERHQIDRRLRLQAVGRHLPREAFPDLECTIEDMVTEGDKVVMRFRSGGTHQGETETFGPPRAGGWR